MFWLEFDCGVFENIVEKVIIGGYDEDDPWVIKRRSGDEKRIIGCIQLVSGSRTEFFAKLKKAVIEAGDRIVFSILINKRCSGWEIIRNSVKENVNGQNKTC